MAAPGMHGASADALATLEDHLEGVRDTDLERLGEDLFGFAGLLRTEAAVRRVATDPSAEIEARTGLVRALLEGKVSEDALDLMAKAVSHRWAANRDLADAVEHLGVIAIVRSAGDQGTRLADELFTVGGLVGTDVDLRDALSDPSRSTEDKTALLRGLLEDRALPATIRLTEQSLRSSHRNPSAALATYELVAAEVQNQRVATVRVARPLAEADERRLRDALSRQYDRQIHLNVVLEPELIGGMRVEIGDDVIDGTLSARLETAQRAIAG